MIELGFISILMIQALVVLGAIGLLIYFIVKRIEAKRNETFEDRDN